MKMIMCVDMKMLMGYENVNGDMKMLMWIWKC